MHATLDMTPRRATAGWQGLLRLFPAWDAGALLFVRHRSPAGPPRMRLTKGQKI